MRKLKFGIGNSIIAILLILPLLMSIGCASMVHYGLGSTILLGGVLAGGTAGIHQQIEKADLTKTADVDLANAEVAVKTALQNLGVEIKEAKRNEKGDGAGVIGSTSQHKEIKVLMATITPQTTRIGIWVKKGRISRDEQFARLIAQHIDRELAKVEGSVVSTTPSPTFPRLVIIKNAHVRENPTTQSRSIAVLKSGTEVTQVGLGGEWVAVEFESEEGKKEGWIYRTLVRPKI